MVQVILACGPCFVNPGSITFILCWTRCQQQRLLANNWKTGSEKWHGLIDIQSALTLWRIAYRGWRQNRKSSYEATTRTRPEMRWLGGRQEKKVLKSHNLWYNLMVDPTAFAERRRVRCERKIRVGATLRSEPEGLEGGNCIYWNEKDGEEQVLG